MSEVNTASLMYNQFNNRKDGQLMKGERQCMEYFDFSQKNCMGNEIFNSENEWSGNPA